MEIRRISIVKNDNNKFNNMLHIVGLLAVVVIMISVMIHYYYYYYYSKDDTNHLEKHKDNIKSKILTDDMLTSDKIKKEKKRLSLLDTFFICLKKIFHFVCPSLQTMNNSNNNMKMMRKNKRKEIAVGEKLNDTMTTVNKTMPVTTIVVDNIREEKLEKLKNELIEIFKDESKKMIKEELNMFKNTIDEKVKMLKNKINQIENIGGKDVKKKDEIVIDYTFVKNLIEKAIEKYDSDKTELVDYALESAGGRIIEASGDKSFFDDWYNLVELPFIFLKSSPRIIIQRTTSSLVPGNAWCFKGSSGYVTIGLSYGIYITAITYEHIHIKNSPSEDLFSAPKDLEIFGIDEDDYSCNSIFSIGNFTFKANEPSMQTFEIKKKYNNKTYEMVKIKIKSNYGASFTCLYRIRVHGQQNFK